MTSRTVTRAASRWIAQSDLKHTSLKPLEAISSDAKASHFYFAQLADTQLGFDGTDDSYDRDLKNTGLAVDLLNQLRPRPQFVVVCGDLTNFLPELSPHMPSSSINLYRQQVSDYKRLFERLHASIPLVCVCGNHDVGNRPTATTLQRYRDEFGSDYLSFSVADTAFVCINSNLLSDPSGAPTAAAAQRAWIQRQLAEAQRAGARHTIVFGHHPLYLRDPEEPDKDPSLGRDILDNGFQLARDYYHLPTDARLWLLHLFKKHRVSHYFCGHFHRNLITYSRRFGVNQVVTSAVGRQLADDDHGFRLVKVLDRSIEHQYFALSAMPNHVTL